MLAHSMLAYMFSQTALTCSQGGPSRAARAGHALTIPRGEGRAGCGGGVWASLLCIRVALQPHIAHHSTNNRYQAIPTTDILMVYIKRKKGIQKTHEVHVLYMRVLMSF